MGDFTWGDSVRVKETASSEKRPGAYAAVCGITKVETAERARKVGEPIGTTVYLIEFVDGSAIEVSGEWLEKDESG